MTEPKEALEAFVCLVSAVRSGEFLKVWAVLGSRFATGCQNCPDSGQTVIRYFLQVKGLRSRARCQHESCRLQICQSTVKFSRYSEISKYLFRDFYDRDRLQEKFQIRVGS